MATVVPVERIELPTFGLQNRCSTAELNRQTRFNRSTPQMFRRAGRRRLKQDRARRQIPELSGKGYSHTGPRCGIIVGPEALAAKQSGITAPSRSADRCSDGRD